ncbi:MAG: hypothetical protein ACRD3W_19400, partial [Terriglobales bacterium]
MPLLHVILWLAFWVLLVLMVRFRSFAAVVLGWMWKQKIILALLIAGGATILELVGLKTVVGIAPTLFGVLFQL